MVAQTAIAGWGAYVNYGYEQTYGGGAVSARTFGRGVKLTISRKNNMERIYGLGARNATANVAKQYEGSATVEFVMSNGSFFRGVLGAVIDGGAAPYTHTYTEANTLPSIAIDTGSELGTTDEVTELKGCVINSGTITAAVNEVARVKLDMVYNNETLATTGIGSQVAETEEPFVFSQGTLTFNESTVAYVQNFEVTFNNTAELIYGLGSRFATTQVAKQREYNFTISAVFADPTTFLTTFYGASGGPHTATPASVALVLTFTNGLAGANTRSVVMTFANAYLNEETLPKDVNEVLKEDLTGYALSCTSVVYSNNTASDDDVP